MRKRFEFLLIVLVLICSQQGFSQVEEYEYRRPILQAKPGWNAISIPLNLFSKTHTDLSDVRIYRVDKGGNKSIEQPYILDIQKSKEDKIDVEFKIINPTKTDGYYTYTFELSNKQSVDNIKLNFINTNFDWNIKLEASMDQNKWSTIIDDYRIVAIKNQETNFHYTDIPIPESKFNFYRLSFYSTITPLLDGASISKKIKSNSNYNAYAIRSHKIEEDKELKTTIIDLDLGQKLPVSQVKINCNNKNDYYRSFKIEGVVDSFKTETGWHYKYVLLYQGTVNSINDNIYNFYSRFLQKLKITIKNFDNQPLEFGDFEVKGPNYRLITRLDDSENIFLCYGKQNASRPLYDISYFKDKIPDDLNAATPGEPSHYPANDKGSGPFFKNKWWLWGIMLFVIILLGTFTIKMLKEEK